MNRRDQLVQNRTDLDRQIGALKERRKAVQDQIDEIDSTLVGQQEINFDAPMSTSITDDPRVQELAERFDLAIPQSFRCLVTEWHYSITTGTIVIEAVKVYDTGGKFIKDADLSLLQKTAHNFTFVFQNQQ
jgi:hypothetical protein